MVFSILTPDYSSFANLFAGTIDIYVNLWLNDLCSRVFFPKHYLSAYLPTLRALLDLAFKELALPSKYFFVCKKIRHAQVIEAFRFFLVFKCKYF